MKPFYYFFTFGLGFLLCFLLLKQCNPEPIIPQATHHETWKYDTIWPDTVFKKIIVKVPGPITTIPIPFYDSLACKFNRVYSDSLVDSNLVIVYRDSINGLLLSKKMSYKLKIPLRINTTHTIVDSISFFVTKPVNGLYGSLEIGYFKGSAGLSIGADFISKKKSGFGYRYDIINRTHNVSGKFRIFSF